MGEFADIEEAEQEVLRLRSRLDDAARQAESDERLMKAISEARDTLTTWLTDREHVIDGLRTQRSFQNARIEELLREGRRLEDKVMAEVERSSRTRDSIVRMKTRLRGVKDELAKALETLVAQRQGNRDEQIRHRGFVEGMADAHARQVDRLERTLPKFIGQIDTTIVPSPQRGDTYRTIERLLREESRRHGSYVDRIALERGPENAATAQADGSGE